MSTKTHTNTATKRNADRILDELRAVRDDLKESLHGNEVVWFEVDTADLFAKCKKKGDFIASAPFTLRGHVGFVMRIFGAGNTDTKQDGRVAFQLVHLPRIPADLNCLLVRATSVRLIEGTPKGCFERNMKVLVEQEMSSSPMLWNFSGGGFYWGWADFSSKAVLDMHPKVTFRLEVSDVSVVASTAAAATPAITFDSDTLMKIAKDFFGNDDTRGISKAEFFTAGKGKGCMDESLLESTWFNWEEECLLYTTTDDEHFAFAE